MRASATTFERAFVQECLNFNGNGQSVEAAVPQTMQFGGSAGLTVVARVRRTKDCGPAWDRLIDFGNGESKENIVINFQNEMMYEVRGEHGTVNKLSVCAEEDSDDVFCARDPFPKNEWVHISLVHGSDGTASIFWNGRLKARGPVHLPQKVKRDKYYVGRSHWQDDPYFQGDISELHVFDYALSDRDVSSVASQRRLPSDHRDKAVISLADSWREVASPLRLTSSWPTGVAYCGQRGCGGAGRCANADAESASTPLHFQLGLSGVRAENALAQLLCAVARQSEQIAVLSTLGDAARAIGATRDAERIAVQVANSHDARRRAQAVARMIQYQARIPTNTREEAATGQIRQPPRIAAAIDPISGVYHGFAIYELRSGDRSHGSRFHVYVTDLLNVRCLLPLSTCWRQNVGSVLISLLQRKADAEQEVVVLRALQEDVQLEDYYLKLGFKSSPKAFHDNGLADSYANGDLLFT